MHHDSIDRYAGRTSLLHRLDARAKLLAALAYTAAAVSEPRHEIAGLLPYLVPPVGAILLSGIPAGFILKRLLAISPFVLVVAAVNPLFETAPVEVAAGPWTAVVRAGWVTATSISLKFLVSALALLGLATTTRLSRVAGALSSLGLPRLLAMQVTILYRYLFLVIDEFERRRRAAEARTVGVIGLAARARLSGSQLAGLFSRSLERAERVSQAMAARGFDGTLPRTPGERLRLADAVFLIVSLALAAGLRFRGLWT
jgi:cobalt/nickel transport system permease protein